MKEIHKINKECVTNRILITRLIFLRALSLIYLISFISLYYQIQGLWGNSGILPANIFLSKLKQNNTAFNYITTYPSIGWLLNTDNSSYQIENLMFILCLIGIIISLLILFQYSIFFNFFGFSILWYVNYNFYFLGQTFMRFSWDELFLEIGFITIFFSPLNLNGNKTINHISHINNIAFYLLKFILLKFMISSGLNIFTSKCDYWKTFNGLDFFFEEQPLLSPLSYSFHSYLSNKLKKILTAFGYFCMVYLPFGYFLYWRRFSIYAGQITFIFNLFFLFAGNYGYLNLLIIVLNVLNFDDFFFRAIIPGKLLLYLKLDYLTSLIPLYIKEMKERRKIILKKENKIIEIKKKLDAEKENENVIYEKDEKEKNKIEKNKKLLNLKKKFYKAKQEVINLVEEDYSDGPKIESTLKIESNVKNEIFIFINFFCINLILIFFFIYPINNLLKNSLRIKDTPKNKYKIIIIIFSIIIYLYILFTIILNFTNKIRNSLLSDKSIVSSVITNIIEDKKGKKNTDNDSEESSEDDDKFDEKEYGINEKEPKKNTFINVSIFTFNVIRYFSIVVIFSIYFIGSVKYFLLNMDIVLFEEKVRNSKIANHLEKTNYGIYKYIVSISDALFGNYFVYGIYGNNLKEILNANGRNEIEIEYLYKQNNSTWNNIDFKYKLGKDNTNQNFLFFHTPRLDFEMYDVAYNEDINEDPWMVSLIGKIFQKNNIILDLFNYDIEEKKILKKISLFENVKEIVFGRKKSLLKSNDEIDKIRIDIFKYKFNNKTSFQRKRYKEYLAQIEKYAIILINEKLDLPELDFNEKIKFNKFQFIPIIDIVIIFILFKLWIKRFI